jgi:thioredoxin 1
MKKNLVIIAIIILIAIVAVIPSLKNNSIDVDKLLNDAVKSNKAVLLELSSATCSTCRKMQPFLKEIQDQYSSDLIIKTLDIAARTDIAQKFLVTAIPTQVFINKNGEIYFKHVGYMSKNQIISVLKEMGL